MRRVMMLMAVIVVLASKAPAEPVISVSVAGDQHVIGVGGHVTVQVLAEVTDYASGSDGLFSYDVNAVFDSIGIVDIVPGSISQPGSGTPMSAGTAGAGGLATCYGTYFYEQGYGIGGPKELVSFDVTGLALGTVVVTVTPDTTIGADFTLQESSSLTVDYSAACVSLVVARPGDTDGDGDVDNSDIGKTAGSFTGAGVSTTKTWSDGDMDGDGDVDNGDIGLVAGAFTGSHAGNLTGMSSAPVPEPATLALLALGGLAVSRRRRAR